MRVRHSGEYTTLNPPLLVTYLTLKQMGAVRYGVRSGSYLFPYLYFVLFMFTEVLSDEDKLKMSKIKKKVRQKVFAGEQNCTFCIISSHFALILCFQIFLCCQ